MQKYANLVELEKCCQTHIFLKNFVLIQPRTSPLKICKILLPDCTQSVRGCTLCRALCQLRSHEKSGRTLEDAVGLIRSALATKGTVDVLCTPSPKLTRLCRTKHISWFKPHSKSNLTLRPAFQRKDIAPGARGPGFQP